MQKNHYNVREIAEYVSPYVSDLDVEVFMQVHCVLIFDF